jgi:hypothetical protein
MKSLLCFIATTLILATVNVNAYECPGQIIANVHVTSSSPPTVR